MSLFKAFAFWLRKPEDDSRPCIPAHIERAPTGDVLVCIPCAGRKENGFRSLTREEIERFIDAHRDCANHKPAREGEE